MNTAPLATLMQDSKKFIWEIVPQREQVELIKIQLLEDAPLPSWYENHPSIKNWKDEIIAIKCITSTGLKTHVWMGKKTFEKHFSHLL